MKKINIAPPVTVHPNGDENEGFEFTMQQWLNAAINMYEPFGKGFENVSQGLKIKAIIDKGEKTFQLEDADYKVLHNAVENAPLKPVIAMACMPYYKAIEEATDTT